MVAASPDSGLIICNPNNPTGSITKRSDIEWLVAGISAWCMIVACITTIAGISPYTDMVAPTDVIVLRTFSCRWRESAPVRLEPDLLKKMGAYMVGALSYTAMAAANAA